MLYCIPYEYRGSKREPKEAENDNTLLHDEESWREELSEVIKHSR